MCLVAGGGIEPGAKQSRTGGRFLGRIPAAQRRDDAGEAPTGT